MTSQVLCAYILSNILILALSLPQQEPIEVNEPLFIEKNAYKTGLEHSTDPGQEKAILVYDDELELNDDPNIISENLEDLDDRIQNDVEEYEPPIGSDHEDSLPQSVSDNNYHREQQSPNYQHENQYPTQPSVNEQSQVNGILSNGLNSIADAGHNVINHKKNVISHGLNSVNNIWSRFNPRVWTERENHRNKGYNFFGGFGYY